LLKDNGSTTGTTTLTLTATASTGGTSTRNFTAQIVADQNNLGSAVNDPPILNPVSNQVTPINTPATFTLTRQDLESNTPAFEAVLQGTSASNATASVDGNGLVSVAPNQGCQGALKLLVVVKDHGAT